MRSRTSGASATTPSTTTAGSRSGRPAACLHRGVGRADNRADNICLVHNDHATVITHDGEALGDRTLDPAKNYQPRDG